MKPYQPSNGTEGMMFYDAFCDHCEHDRKYRETLDGEYSCAILRDTMLYDPGDEKYPKEWIIENDYTNPRCTAFLLENSEESAKHHFKEQQKNLEAAGQLKMFD